MIHLSLTLGMIKLNYFNKVLIVKWNNGRDGVNANVQEEDLVYPLTAA